MAALSVQPHALSAHGWWHDLLRLLWFHLKVFVFFGHELLYLLYPYLSLFLPLLFSTSLFLFLSLQCLPLFSQKGSHLWSFHSAYILIEVLTINHWGVWPDGTCNWPISSCSVILNGSVLKWQTCDFISDCCVLCREPCSVCLKSAILKCKMCV